MHVQAEPEEEAVPQLVWRVIDEPTAKQLRKMTVEDVAKWGQLHYCSNNMLIWAITFVRKLANVLSLRNHEVCLREAALLDYYVAAYWYPKEL